MTQSWSSDNTTEVTSSGMALGSSLESSRRWWALQVWQGLGSSTHYSVFPRCPNPKEALRYNNWERDPKLSLHQGRTPILWLPSNCRLRRSKPTSSQDKDDIVFAYWQPFLVSWVLKKTKATYKIWSVTYTAQKKKYDLLNSY